MSWPRNPGQRSLKSLNVVPFDRLDMAFEPFMRYSTSKYVATLKSGSKVKDSPGNWVLALGVKKIESWATGPRKKFDDIFSRLKQYTDTIHQRDGRTDRRTRFHSKDRTSRRRAGNTRNLAIADKPRDAFSGQSKSPNMVPFHMLGMVSYYCAIVTLSMSIVHLYGAVMQHLYCVECAE